MDEPSIDRGRRRRIILTSQLVLDIGLSVFLFELVGIQLTGNFLVARYLTTTLTFRIFRKPGKVCKTALGAQDRRECHVWESSWHRGRLSSFKLKLMYNWKISKEEMLITLIWVVGRTIIQMRINQQCSIAWENLLYMYSQCNPGPYA